MLILDVLLGLGLLFGAALTAALRRAGRHDLLAWREPLQRAFGDRAGDLAHLALYTLAPASLGVGFLLLAALRSGALG